MPDAFAHDARPVVVLLHSSASSSQQWNGLAETLATRYRVIAPDLCGYGAARPFAVPAGPHSLAHEVEAIERKLALLVGPTRQFHLVGHSFGGAVALKFTSLHAARVLSLTLFEPTAFHLLDPGSPVLSEVKAVAAGVRRALGPFATLAAAGAFIDFWNGPGSFARLPEERKAAFCGHIPKIQCDFEALFGDTLDLAQCRAIATPVCMLSGRQSPACAYVVADTLYSALSGRIKEFYTIDSGHMGPITHTRTVNPIIERFLKGIESRIPQPAHLRSAVLAA